MSSKPTDSLDKKPDPETCDSADLFKLIHESDEATLEKALTNPNLTADHVVLIFENKYLTPNIVRRICDEPQWVGKYKIKMAIVNCPLTPKVVALTLVKFLYWKDLTKVSKNLRIIPPVRHMADVTLKDRLPEITVGEKVSLARMASRTLIRSLVYDKNEMVVRALLENPLLTEENLINLATNQNTDPRILSILGTHKKWAYRYGIKMALLRNRRTPVSVAVHLLSGLLESDLRGIVEKAGVPKVVKLCAGRVIKEKESKRKDNLN